MTSEHTSTKDKGLSESGTSMTLLPSAGQPHADVLPTGTSSGARSTSLRFGMTAEGTLDAKPPMAAPVKRATAGPCALNVSRAGARR